MWAPSAREVSVEVVTQKGRKMVSRMGAEAYGFWVATVPGAGKGSRYAYVLDGKKRRPDPASRYQPGGVHAPSEVVDGADFSWTDDAWRGVPLGDLLIYELHVGTYTGEGTFEALIPHLDHLRKELGVTAIELMPVGQFPGNRNWGYDGVQIFAPQNSYGGPRGLKRLVDRCHEAGLAVFLDVVYNHLGPEGNYLGDFGPYFSYKYKTPWGPAMNYDDAGCDQVRAFVVKNALYWIGEYHMDGLRLDAVHGIFDFSPTHILTEIGDAVHAQRSVLGRELHVIPESDLNDPKVISPKDAGGYALDAQWSDDFHHSVHCYLTGERSRHYIDFGRREDIEKALRDGFVYDGRYSKFRGKTFGAPSSWLPGWKFVVFLQNHDQVGNRADGARLSSLLSPPELKVAVGLLLLAPNIPLLFMGEEFGETAPFYYFISHSDKKLIEAVREGRKTEFEISNEQGRDARYADPQDPATFEMSKVHHELKHEQGHREILRYYEALIRFRKSHPAVRSMNREWMEVQGFSDKRAIAVRRWEPGVENLLMIYALGEKPVRFALPSGGRWERKVFDSAAGPAASGNGSGEKKEVAPSVELEPFSLSIYSDVGYLAGVRATRRRARRRSG